MSESKTAPWNVPAHLLTLINRPRLPIRWPFKGLIFALAVFVVCFPSPFQFIRHVERWRAPDHLIEPNAPALQPWFEEIQSRLTTPRNSKEDLHQVEAFVYEKLPYAYDWDLWGNADYIPTVAEALQAGREDCDGRAVVAASLLARMGYKPRLVTDFGHVWVWTEQGETMSPGQSIAVVAEEGGKLALQPSALADLFQAAALGLRIFNPYRELILAVILWLLLLGGPRIRFMAGVQLALILLAFGVIHLGRVGGYSALRLGGASRMGIAGALLGIALLLALLPLFARKTAR